MRWPGPITLAPTERPEAGSTKAQAWPTQVVSLTLAPGWTRAYTIREQVNDDHSSRSGPPLVFVKVTRAGSRDSLEHGTETEAGAGGLAAAAAAAAAGAGADA